MRSADNDDGYFSIFLAPAFDFDRAGLQPLWKLRKATVPLLSGIVLKIRRQVLPVINDSMGDLVVACTYPTVTRPFLYLVNKFSGNHSDTEYLCSDRQFIQLL